MNDADYTKWKVIMNASSDAMIAGGEALKAGNPELALRLQKRAVELKQICDQIQQGSTGSD